MRRVFIDCGGHQGTSVQYFRRVYPNADQYEIFSFEANPTFNRYFEEYPDVVYRNVAVWREDGEILFYNNGRGSSTVIRGKAERGGFQDNRLEVPCIDFSRWLGSTFSRGDYIVLKLDIEGAEYAVLDKMLQDRTIDYVNRLYVDWHCAKTNGGIPIEQHLHTLKGLVDRGLVPYSWAAQEALQAGRNGNDTGFGLDRLNKLAVSGREKKIMPAHLEKAYNEILSKVETLRTDVPF